MEPRQIEIVYNEFMGIVDGTYQPQSLSVLSIEGMRVNMPTEFLVKNNWRYKQEIIRICLNNDTISQVCMCATVRGKRKQYVVREGLECLDYIMEAIKDGRNILLNKKTDTPYVVDGSSDFMSKLSKTLALRLEDVEKKQICLYSPPPPVYQVKKYYESAYEGVTVELITSYDGK